MSGVVFGKNIKQRIPLGGLQSAISGRPTPASGDLDTLMAGLACGEVSHVAWPVLAAGAEFFMTIEDPAAVECMRLLHQGGLDSKGLRK